MPSELLMQIAVGAAYCADPRRVAELAFFAPPDGPSGWSCRGGLVEHPSFVAISLTAAQSAPAQTVYLRLAGSQCLSGLTGTASHSALLACKWLPFDQSTPADGQPALPSRRHEITNHHARVPQWPRSIGLLMLVPIAGAPLCCVPARTRDPGSRRARLR